MNPKALVRSATVVIGLIAVATIVSELSHAVKDFFALIIHHWVGKSVFSLVFLGLLYLAFKRGSDELTLKDAWWLIGTLVVSGLAIVIFYVLHFFG